MISVTRLNGSHFFLNADLVKFVEATPDTVITLTDSTKLVVRETPLMVVQAVIAYHRQVLAERVGVRGEAT